MATYVLVHGAWHGGWCWRKLAPLLRAQGHDVYTPTLTGLGERSHLRLDGVNLSMHVQDVVNVLEYEDLRDVVLVGHSYGGMVVTGAADRAHDRIAHLVYLDAFVPSDGASMIDLLGFTRPEYEGNDNWIEPISTFGVTDADDLAWVTMKMSLHPVATMNEKLKLSAAVESWPFSRTYVLAAGQPMGAFPRIAQTLRADPRWQVTELPTGHDMMVTMPSELSAILLSVIKRTEEVTR